MQVIETITNEPLHFTQMANGLPVLILPKQGFQKKYAVFAVHFGSLDSEFEVAGKGVVKVPDGIAHFLEHKLFEDATIPVFERFAKFGASVNAYTSYNLTAYLFSIIDFFPEALRELLHFVQNPYLTEENVAKERGIIEQELRMYDDHPDRRIYRNLLNALYHRHPIRIDVGGTFESIGEITVDLLWECYRLFYQPANMALAVVGDVNPAEVLDIAARQMEEWQYQAQDIKRLLPDEPDTVNKPWIEERMSISQPRCYLGFKHNQHLTGRRLLKQQLAMNMIWHSLGARSSPVFAGLYDSGLINDSFEAGFHGTPQYAFSMAGGETDDPQQLDKALREAIADLQKKLLNTEQVERIKRHILGGYLAAFNSLDYLANSLISHLFHGTSYLDVPEVLESLTVDEVNQYICEAFDLDRSAVSVLLPE
jgi:predicted Zn-dependent peptidase